MTAIWAAILPVIIKILFGVMKAMGVRKENMKKVIQAVQGTGALKSAALKKQVDAIDAYLDNRDKQS